MIKEVQVTTTTTKRQYFCDVCGNKFTPYGFCQCFGCGKHLCERDTHYAYRHPFTLDDTDDFARRYCAACDDSLLALAPEIERIHEEFEAKIAQMQSDWQSSRRKDTQ